MVCVEEIWVVSWEGFRVRVLVIRFLFLDIRGVRLKFVLFYVLLICRRKILEVFVGKF